ncbi:MAG: cell filamentation protein Fic [Clostridia bacterium]|nr:cell filamentation protein Fic [Clostridia bacterium]
MSDEENYIIENETTDAIKKQEYWETGIGLNKVDNLEPSKYLLELSQKNINGDLKYYEVEKLLKSYYETQDTSNTKIQNEKECDLVSLRIASMLEDKSFGFSPVTLKNIHKYLFKDIYDFAGNYRDYNITKKENILNGDTVKYVNYQDINSYFEYDFNNEKEFDYSQLDKSELVSHIAKFTSSIWQVHPFGEGNTRTVAVFIEKYLNNMGFNVNNTMFKENSLYFRNALVRSNYGNIPKGIYPTFDYLIMFFENLLENKAHELKNRELYVKELFD